MFLKNKGLVCLLGIVVIGFWAVPAFAEGLLGTGHSYYYDSQYWEGTVEINSTPGQPLEGSVDWAVFTADEFNSLFGGGGYMPTSGQLVYTYQLHNGPESSTITLYDVLIQGSAPMGNPGWFEGVDPEVTGQDPSSSVLGVSQVLWYFSDLTDQGGANYNLDPDEASMGLAFCSDRNPQTGVSIAVNEGESAWIPGVASPGTVEIPEPSIITLLVGAMATLGISVIRWHRRR